MTWNRSLRGTRLPFPAHPNTHSSHRNGILRSGVHTSLTQITSNRHDGGNDITYII